VISCLTLLAHSIIKYAGTELRLFSSFSSWLRHEIDVQAADPTSGDDPTEKDQVIEHVNVLEYIQGALTKSNLSGILPQEPADGKPSVTASSMDGQSLYEGFKKTLGGYPANAEGELSCIRLSNLTGLLDRQCGVVFEQIAEAQKRNVLFGSPIELPSEVGGHPLDMRMLYEVRATFDPRTPSSPADQILGQHQHHIRRRSVGGSVRLQSVADHLRASESRERRKLNRWGRHSRRGNSIGDGEGREVH
jgi:anaphase-promoting complex subunit 4